MASCGTEARFIEVVKSDLAVKRFRSFSASLLNALSLEHVQVFPEILGMLKLVVARQVAGPGLRFSLQILAPRDVGGLRKHLKNVVSLGPRPLSSRAAVGNALECGLEPRLDCRSFPLFVCARSGANFHRLEISFLCRKDPNHVSIGLTLLLPQISESTFSQPFKSSRSDIVRIGSIIFYLRKLGKAKFFVLCGVVLLVRLQGKLEIDHSWE